VDEVDVNELSEYTPKETLAHIEELDSEDECLSEQDNQTLAKDSVREREYHHS